MQPEDVKCVNCGRTNPTTYEQKLDGLKETLVRVRCAHCDAVLEVRKEPILLTE